ncbi:MAG: hypothetical protein IPH88_06595 [Bacteroidales bacterium]|nr:hypothetical protein [Bacteroidales bacterium]
MPTVAANLNGQKEPYLQGRKNIKVYTGIPHAPIGPVANVSDYSDGVIVTRIAGQGNGGNFLEFSDATIDEILSKKPADSVNVYGSPDYPIAYQATYKLGEGPINVKVIDPLNVKDGNFTVAFDSLFDVSVPIGSRDTLMPTTRWKLIDNATGTVYKSDTTIDLQNEQLFLDLGISVQLEQTLYPGIYEIESGSYSPMLASNGILGGSITYADDASFWMSFLPDVDGGGSLNWIRSGVVKGEDSRDDDWDAPGKPFDPDQNYEKLLNGTWSPYLLTACAKQDPAGPAYADDKFKFLSKQTSFFSDLASVNIVFTSDKSKWTRCPVVEMGSVVSLAEGKAKQFELRKHRSVNQDGDTAVASTDPAKNSDYISAYGMGWFPGYAINIETGERLNIVFGEDSHLVSDNGADMLFNPSGNVLNNDTAVFGGKHYIYVMSHTWNKETQVPLSQTDVLTPADLNFPAYDAGAHFVYEINRNFPSAVNKNRLRSYLWSNAMWVSIPIAIPQFEWLSTDITVKLRITKPYDRYFSGKMTGEFVPNRDDNNFWPMYNFSTSAVATVQDSSAKAVSDLDKINVVPNPYYGYSPYEVDQLDNRIKIVNLPQRCTISIYSTGGSLIRTFNKDESKTYIDWDLKNFAGIPVAGGVYIIHVKAPGVGEKVIKWFGSLRPVDFNSF